MTVLQIFDQHLELDYFTEGPYISYVTGRRVNNTNVISNFKKGVIRDRDNLKVISFLDDRKKIFTWLSPAFFHVMRDFLFQIIEHNFSPNGPYQIIVDTKHSNLHDNNFSQLALDLFKKLNMDVITFDSSNYDAIEIDNFMVLGGYSTTQNSMLAYEKLKVYLTNKDVQPFRKIYVSRKFRDETTPSYVFKDQRVASHDEIERVFLNAGFEIAYPEKFEKFEDQIQYFYEAKIIAGLSGSGLTNLLFMQPGQTVIEIVSPITIPFFNDVKIKEIHNFYKDLSFLKNHLLINISNYNLPIESLAKNIENVLKSVDFDGIN